MNLRNRVSLIFCLFIFLKINAKDGYGLWLSYQPIQNKTLSKNYLEYFQGFQIIGNSESLQVIQKEFEIAFQGFFPNLQQKQNRTKLLIATEQNLPIEIRKKIDYSSINEEGFFIKSTFYKGNSIKIISAKTDIGLLYGSFRLLQEMQQHHTISNIEISDSPKIKKRVLNHWDNLDRTVERGYAGFSIWDWHLLPDLIKPQYIDYARANASIGINGTVLTNVNANALVLSKPYLQKVKALAEVFRPYGIKVYLTARFSAPIELGNLTTADPLNKDVQQWWKDKVAEIYKEIPDFGGFLVKANSEGQPGPNNYDRSHVEGANMLADALAPHKGIVMWRAFVYSENDPEDRAKQAYSEFAPFDDKFRDNVLLQVKNGPIDFQPREPFHPLFGAMPNTSLMMEFQITQEYLGFSSHLVFLPKLYEEVLQEDTFTSGKNTLVANIIDGSASNQKLTGIAGVANIGTAKNWTGHPFGQANWYGYGRLAWNPYLDAETIAEEWLKMTFSTDQNFVDPVKEMMLSSREAVVNYMTPLGLHHIMATGHHYGPGPWVDNLSRPEWNPVYYHKATKNGIGFDRSKTGSNAISQYANPIEEKYNSAETTPEKYLLWFHHLPWDYQMKNQKSLWENLALHYQKGVQQVKEMNGTWQSVKPYVDKERFEKVSMLLHIQLKEAKWWRDACLLYFKQYSNRQLPGGVPKPEHSLEHYKSLKFPYAPGIKPAWN